MTTRRVTPPSNGDTATVLQVLQRRNPDIVDEWAGVSFGNTKSQGGHFDEVRLGDNHAPLVTPWTDFTFNAIHLAFGDILDQDITALHPKYRPVYTPSPSQRKSTVKGEPDVDELGLAWSTEIVRAPLRAAAARLRPLVSTHKITDAALFHHGISWSHPSYPSVTFNPDWAAIDNDILLQYREDDVEDGKKPLVYVVGDSKLKQKWKSEWLTRGMTDLKVTMDLPFKATKKASVLDIKHERCYPLMQISTYCRYAQTRYAYILTQTELVALRIRRLPQQPDMEKHYAGIEYTSVPWGATTGLTINLAIWALSCMGMNDGHREMEGPDNSPLPDMARLTWWTHDKRAGIYQNVISKRQIPAAEWKKEYDAFVHLDDKHGKSSTSNLFPSANVSSLTQQLGGMNLGRTGGPAAAARPSRRVPVAAPTGSTSTGSNPSNARLPRRGMCEIDGDKYPAEFHNEYKKWTTMVNGTLLVITFDLKIRRHITTINGKEVRVTVTPDTM